MEVTAIADYIATDTEQIDLKIGDLVQVILKENNDWWYGKRQKDNAIGWFPAAYVVLSESSSLQSKSYSLEIKNATSKPPISPKPKFVKTTKVENVEKINFENKAKILEQKLEFKENNNQSVTTTKQQLNNESNEFVVAITPYTGTSLDQLSLKIGDIIQVQHKTESGWWMGQLINNESKTVSWFPSSYVKPLSEEYHHFNKIKEPDSQNFLETKLKSLKWIVDTPIKMFSMGFSLNGSTQTTTTNNLDNENENTHKKPSISSTFYINENDHDNDNDEVYSDSSFESCDSDHESLEPCQSKSLSNVKKIE